MKKLIFTCSLLLLMHESQARFISPDYDLKGLTKNNQKCHLIINLEEKYVSFETPKQMCEFSMDEEDVNEFRNPADRQISAKGYSNWFDCKVKVTFDERGKPLKAKLHSRLPLAMTFRSEDCYF
jgi:hypothetical protein